MLEIAGLRLQRELGIQQEVKRMREYLEGRGTETREERTRRLARIRAQRHRTKLKDARSDIAALSQVDSSIKLLAV